MFRNNNNNNSVFKLQKIACSWQILPTKWLISIKITAINNCAILQEIAHFSKINKRVKTIIELCFVFLLLIVVSSFVCVKDSLFSSVLSDDYKFQESLPRRYYFLVRNYFQLTVIKNYGRKLRLRSLLCWFFPCYLIS